MQTGKRYSRSFKAISIEQGFGKGSLFGAHHIYIAPQALRQMGLSWGQQVEVSGMGKLKNEVVRSFILSNETLRKDEIILGQQVARALNYHISGFDMIVVRYDQNGKISQKNYLDYQFTLEQVNQKNSKPSSPLNYPPCIFARKQKYQLIAFISEGTFKVQIKSFIRRNFAKNVRLLHGIELESIGLDYYKIMNCLNQPKYHYVMPQMGILLLKPDGEQGQSFQIKLKEVPIAFSLDTEMAIAYIQSVRKQICSKEISFYEGKTSYYKNDPEQFPEQMNVTPITADNTNTHGPKSMTRNSEICHIFGVPSPGLKRRKQSSCQEPKAKNFHVNQDVDPKVKYLETKMGKIEDQIRQIKENNEKLKKRSEENIQVIKEIRRQTNESLNSIVKEDWLAIEKVKKQIQSCQKQFSESSEFTKNMLKRSLMDIDNKLKQFSLNWSRVSSSGINEREQRDKQCENLIIPFSPKVDRNSPYIDEFEIEGIYRQIIRKKGKDSWAQISTVTPLIFKRKTSCSLRILNSKFNFIMIGIIDKKMAKNISSWTRDHSLVLMGWNGVIYENGQKKQQTGLKIQNNCDVFIEVEPEAGMIHWSLNNNRFSVFSKVLQKEKIQWVPYIEMFCQGDTVQWQ